MNVPTELIVWMLGINAALLSFAVHLGIRIFSFILRADSRLQNLEREIFRSSGSSKREFPQTQ